MTVAFESGYTLPSGDLPLNHARVLHDGNRFKVKTITASSELALYPGTAANSGDTVDRWRPFANGAPSPLDFSEADWTATAITVGSDGQTLTETTATSQHDISAAYTFTAAEHVLAFDVDPQTMPEVQVLANDGTTSFTCFFDLRDKTIGTAANCTGKIVQNNDGSVRLLIVFTPVAATGVIELLGSDGAETVSYTGSTSNTVKVTQAIVHLSEATLTYDLFTAQEGDTFAIAAHNLWSSGATLELLGAANLITNGDFSGGTTGWTGRTGATLSAVSGKLRVTGDGAQTFPNASSTGFPTVIGRKYYIEGTSTFVSGTDNDSYIQKSDSAIAATNVVNLGKDEAGGFKSGFFTATSTTTFIRLVMDGASDVYDWDNIVVQEVTAISPADNSPIMAFIEPATSDKWRIQVSGGALPEIGVFRVGKSLQMERPFYGGFTIPRMARNTVVRGNISGSGELLGRSKERTTLRTQYQWQHLTYDWVRANLDGPTGLIQAAESEPVFLAWRPSVTQDVDYIMRASTDAPNAMGLRDLWTFGMSGEAHSYE